MKKKKDEAAAGFRETLRATLRAYKIWNRYAPNLLTATALHSVFSALAPYVPVYFSAQILNELAGARDPERLTTLVLLTLSVTAALALVTALLRRWKEVCSSAKYQRDLFVQLDKMLSMDFQAADAPQTHELLSQIRQNTNWYGHGLILPISYLEKLIQPIFGILGAAALTVSLFTAQAPAPAGGFSALNSPLITALALLLLLGVTFLAPICQNKSTMFMVKSAELIKSGNRAFGFNYFTMQERSRALDTRIYRQDRLLRHYAEEDLLGVDSPLAKCARGPMGLWGGAAAAVSAVFTGLVYAFVCLKAWAGAFAVGSVAQYVGAITALSGSVGTLVSTWGEFRANAVFLRQTYKFLDTPSEMYQGSLTTEKRSDRNYEIEFRDVSFRYPGAGDYALRHVSMKFRVGERLAVVGENGSGKTTFIKLLCRLYDPTEGAILLNGIDIRKYDYDEYIALFSVVFQDFQLLSFSLGQNVAAAVQYNPERAKACLQKAGFGDRLAQLPDGLETKLYKDFDEKGVQISGGEAQKIALARALYKDAPFVVLDEPTAALDPIAEMEVYEKFNEIVGDRTAVYISHRLSSCRFCDSIAVFDHGSIIQRGTHESLLQNEDGKYFALWNAQAQYYVEH
ncbi:MAG: ABC transporter ATP-binding protein [Acutalibacteraceae bacterium]|jgi:ATP-binding cassette subfamily B protein